MTDPAPTFRLTGAQYLGPNGLTTGDLGVARGRIAPDADGPALPLDGLVILPGIVDAHGDGFERHLAPRRGAVTDLRQGLTALEAELAANGITTAMLAQFWSWEGGMRGPDFARALARALDAFPARTDLRLQLRVEIGCLSDAGGDAAAILDLIATHAIPQVVFNDHLPHDRLAQGRTPPRLQGQALKAGRSPEAHRALMQRLHDDLASAEARLPQTCADLIARGVTLASHDDTTPEDRARWRALGVRLAEFPVTPASAEAAAIAGDPIVLGAPNLLRGGSHKSRAHLSADAMLAADIGDALASDYHYPAPFAAMRKRLGEGHALPEIWPLVSSGPARLLGLSDRGTLAPGARADLLITDSSLSAVHATIAGGRFTYVAGPLADRLLTAPRGSPPCA